MSKLNILFIWPGPVMAIDIKRYEDLSQYFTGAITTSSPIKDIFQQKMVAGFAYYCSNSRRPLSMYMFFIETLLKCFYWKISKRNYDLIVTYDPLKTGILGALCKSILKCKLLCEVNGVYTSPAEYLDDSELLSTRLKKWAYPRIEAWVLKRASGVKFLFPEQGKPFKTQLRNKPTASYPNRINIDGFYNCTTIPKEGNQILFAGFPFYRKGVDILISAFKKIANEFPEWHLKILGWYPDTTLLYKAIDNHPRIVHHRPVFPKDMPAHIQECSFFVLPSRSEAMGRVLVESMAAGKARIGANIDGVPTVINDGIDGLLFEPENVNDLAAKIKLLIVDTQLRKRLGEAGRKRAISEFVSTKYMENTVAFYNKVFSFDNNLKK